MTSSIHYAPDTDCGAICDSATLSPVLAYDWPLVTCRYCLEIAGPDVVRMGALAMGETTAVLQGGLGVVVGRLQRAENTADSFPDVLAVGVYTLASLAPTGHGPNLIALTTVPPGTAENEPVNLESFSITQPVRTGADDWEWAPANATSAAHLFGTGSSRITAQLVWELVDVRRQGVDALAGGVQL